MTDQNQKFIIYSEFLNALVSIPPEHQKNVRIFLQEFRAGAIQQELKPIPQASDPTMNIVAVDSDFDAVISQQGNCFFLLWVARYEDACKWSEGKYLRIHPQTGGIQLIQVNPKDPPAVGTVIFDELSPEQLLALGVPEELFPVVRSIASDTELNSLAKRFPQEAYSSLFRIANGESYEEVVQEYERSQAKVVDTKDFHTALSNDDTLSRFAVITNDIELVKLLNAPLEQWRVFLHPLQKHMVETNASGPMRVLGGAGTGKTVVAMHRAKYLLENIFTDKNDRILFTTFTKNLALDIKSSLAKICSVEDMERIEVINLDAWAKRYLTSKGIKFQIIDYIQDEKERLWSLALDKKPAISNESEYTDQFFKDEWEQVIQPNDVFSLQDYLRVSRVGRGRSLNGLLRKKLWSVWEEYRALLLESNYRESLDMYRDATDMLRNEGGAPYRSIIVDEGQDFSTQAYSMIRAMLPAGSNDIFIVGDAHQRIYARQTSLKKSKIFITGRSRKLKVNYRTTRENYQFASAILTGLKFDDFDGQEDRLGACQSLTVGPKPEVRLFEREQEEQCYLRERINALRKQEVKPAEICVALRTLNLVKQYREYFEQSNIPCYEIREDVRDDGQEARIRIATMHRVKGLEFDFVLLPAVCDGILPLQSVIGKLDNEVDKKNAVQRERALFYVAMTRARKAVFITGYGKMSTLLPKAGELN